MGQADQWPSAGRVVHVKDHDGVSCRGASIVVVLGEPGPDADVELFVYPSWRDLSEGAAPFDGQERVHRADWHWPEYVGPAANPLEAPKVTREFTSDKPFA
jgi:hypothetical protein